MKKTTIFLMILLVLDMFSTIYLLKYIPNTTEINPILNQFGNIVFAVVASHVIAMILVWAIDVETRRVKGRDKIRLEIFTSLVIFFYVGVVTFNILNIVLSHLYLM